MIYLREQKFYHIDYKWKKELFGSFLLLVFYLLSFLGNQKENLLTCLADLFHNIATQKRRVGTIAPKRFITKLKKENGTYILNFILNFRFF